MVKPDGVQRGLVGEIIARFERKGFKLVALKLLHASRDLLGEHYKDLASRPFFPNLVTYMVGQAGVMPPLLPRPSCPTRAHHVTPHV